MKALFFSLLFLVSLALPFNASANTTISSPASKKNKIQVWVEQESKIGYRRIDHVVLDQEKTLSSYNGLPYKNTDFKKVQSHVLGLAKNIKAENKSCAAGRFLRVVQVDAKKKTFTRGCLESPHFQSLYGHLRALSLVEQK